MFVKIASPMGNFFLSDTYICCVECGNVNTKKYERFYQNLSAICYVKYNMKKNLCIAFNKFVIGSIQQKIYVNIYNVNLTLI